MLCYIAFPNFMLWFGNRNGLLHGSPASALSNRGGAQPAKDRRLDPALER